MQTTRKKGIIYGLAENGTVKYIGQTTNIKKRYGQHCSLAQNREDTPKQRWIRTLLEEKRKPELTILADSNDLDADEIRFIKKYRDLGRELLNTADGGMEMGHLYRSKAAMPWGRGWSPIQRVLQMLKADMRSKYITDPARIEATIRRVEAMLGRVRKVRGRQGIYQMNLVLWEREQRVN